jgi:archaellum component FlaC
MADKDDLRKQIETQISKLSGDTAKAYRDQLTALNALTTTSLPAYQQLLNNINDTISDMSEGFEGIRSQLTGIVNELSRADTNSKDITKSFIGLRSVAQKLKYDQQGITDLNHDQLKQEKSKVKILQEQLRAAAKIAQDKEDAGEALTEQENAVLLAQKEQFKVITSLNALLDKRIQQEEEINRRLGITGVLLAGMSKIPIVGPLLKTNEALDAAREKAKAGGNMFQAMGAAGKSIGSSLLSSLGDPLVVIGLIVKGFQELLKIGFKVSEQTTSLQKSFVLSSDGAMALRTNFAQITKSSAETLDYQKRQLVNTTNQVEAANQLGEALGASAIPTKQQIDNQIMLTKQIGLSAEEANKLQQLAFDNGVSTDNITKEVIKQTKSYRNQTGIQLDNKKILQDISKVSGQLRLQYGNNVKQLAAAVIQSNKLGFSLEQTKKIAESLLNFEESIENELAAELLINRDLNLEQARLLALNGQSAEATALIASQMGGAAEFSRLNVIQQEALAKALGMSADELADSMMFQERLTALGGVSSQQVTERINQLKEEGKVDLANQLQRDIASGKSAEAALKAVSDQVLFNENIQKLKDLLSDILAGPAKGLADWIASLRINGEGLVFAIKSIGVAIGAISLAKLLSSMASLVALSSANAAANIAAASAITLGIGAAAVIAGIIAAMSAFSTAKKEATQPTNSNFASGGIIGGNATAGDNMTIKANSGEMVLNRNQQAKLFNMINGGGGSNNPTELTANLILDGQVLANAITKIERTNSNKLGSARQESNRGVQ